MIFVSLERKGSVMRCAKCGKRIVNRNRATVRQAYDLLYSPLRPFNGIKFTEREVVIDICKRCCSEYLKYFCFKRKVR